MNEEKLKAFSLKYERKVCPLSSHFFKIIVKILLKAVSQEKEIKGIQTGKEKIKHSLTSGGMIVHIGNPK
jgi:hypothetical protein